MAEGRVLDIVVAFIVGGLLSPALLIWIGERAHRAAVRRDNRDIARERRGKPLPRVNWHV